MLDLRKTAIEPGDIVLAVSHQTDIISRLKRSVQSYTSHHGQHGHREVVSAFVCTGENASGKIFYTHEGHKRDSIKLMYTRLQAYDVNQLIPFLLDYCRALDRTILQDALIQQKYNSEWIESLAELEIDSLFQKIIAAIERTNTPKEVLIKLLIECWKTTDEYKSLRTTNTSLIVFKFNDSDQKGRFLEQYQKSINITNRYGQRKKYHKNCALTDHGRTSWWKIFQGMCYSANQSADDRKENQKIEKSTYCARDVITALNRSNPNLVKRGRYILPKELEAGLREAAQENDGNEQDDDFDFDNIRIPAFSIMPLPCAGTNLMQELLIVIDKELTRLDAKRGNHPERNMKYKAATALLLEYRDPKYKTYNVNLQVDIALTLLARIRPILKRQTDFFKDPQGAKSWQNVRYFARTQAIFDGDIRKKTAELARISTQQKEITPPQRKLINYNEMKHFILSDWSLFAWNQHKCLRISEYLNRQLEQGHAIYVWRRSGLERVYHVDLDDFDLMDDLTPRSRSELEAEIKRCKWSTDVEILDFQTCRERSQDQSDITKVIKKGGEYFSETFSKREANQRSLEITTFQLESAHTDPSYEETLRSLRDDLESEQDENDTYYSGVDTQVRHLSLGYKPQPIFTPLNNKHKAPLRQYQRDEVYTSLDLANESKSEYDLFCLHDNHKKKLAMEDFNYHSTPIPTQRLNACKKSNEAFFLAHKILRLTQYWQPLPSCHPEEIITDLSINGVEQDKFEIEKRANNLYYIRSKSNKHIDNAQISYLVQMPVHYRSNPMFNTLFTPDDEHSDIYYLLKKYLYFTQDRGELKSFYKEGISGEDYLDKLRELKVGSCRLRAIAFKAEIQREHPDTAVNVVSNPYHCFVEVKLNNKWKRYCLGGYSPTLLTLFNHHVTKSISWIRRNPKKTLVLIGSITAIVAGLLLIPTGVGTIPGNCLVAIGAKGLLGEAVLAAAYAMIGALVTAMLTAIVAKLHTYTKTKPKTILGPGLFENKRQPPETSESSHTSSTSRNTVKTSNCSATIFSNSCGHNPPSILSLSPKL